MQRLVTGGIIVRRLRGLVAAAIPFCAGLCLLGTIPTTANGAAEVTNHVVTDLDPASIYDVLLDGEILLAGVRPDEWNVLRFTADTEGAIQVVRVGQGDAVAPGAVRNLELVTVDGTDATLRWVAPGDDGFTGSVHHYEVRASADSVDAAAWALATRLPNVEASAPAGELETGVIRGLVPRSSNFVVLRALDGAGNRGPVSMPLRVMAGEGEDVGAGGAFAAPARPSAVFGTEGVHLAWHRSAATLVVAFHVYRREESTPYERMTEVPLTANEYLDPSVVEGTAYYYRITGVDASGVNETAPSAEVWIRASASVPAALAIERVFPSPVRDRAVFRFAVPELGPGSPDGARVTIELYDSAGHHVTHVADEVVLPGTHEVSWQLPKGQNVPPGVYLGVLRVGSRRAQVPVAIAR